MAFELMKVPVEGNTVGALQYDDGGRYVMLGVVCQQIAVDYVEQARRIEGTGYRYRREVVGGTAHVCLHVDDVPAWINSVHPLEARTAAGRTLLRRYQRTLAPAIKSYVATGFAIAPEHASDPDIQDAVVALQTRLELKRVKADVALQGRRIGALEALTDSRTGFYCIRAWHHLHGRAIPRSEASRDGQALSAICRRRGVTIGKVPDERDGEVNSYPEQVLREFYSWSRP